MNLTTIVSQLDGEEYRLINKKWYDSSGSPVSEEISLHLNRINGRPLFVDDSNDDQPIETKKTSRTIGNEGREEIKQRVDENYTIRWRMAV